MIREPSPIERSEALRRRLLDNESECIRRNIIVRVDSINAEHTVAFCSVEQRNVGLFRRNHTIARLVWHAEQALAPLTSVGIVPLLTIRHKRMKNMIAAKPRRLDRSPMDRMHEVWRWLGYPLAVSDLGAVRLMHDPFGWQQAMLSSRVK